MNTLIIGKSSTGKTSRIIVKEIEEKINKNESFFFLDYKLEYYKHYQRDLIKKGYKVNIVNIQDCIKSNCWNPLMFPFNVYKSDKDKAIEILNNIGETIFENDTVSDIFWSNACRDLFIGFSLILFENAKEEAINLFSINNMLNEEIDYEALLEKYDKFDPIYLSLSEVIKSPKETKESVFALFKQNMNIYLMYENLSNLLSYSDINIEEYKSEKIALFFVNKKDNKKVNNLASMYINELISIYINNDHSIKFNFVLDNLETIPPLKRLNTLLSLSTSHNIDIIIGVKDLDYYKDIYSMRDIDKLYNLDNDASVVIVEKNSKQKYNINKFPIVTLNNIADYPILESHTKFLFNLDYYIRNK